MNVIIPGSGTILAGYLSERKRACIIWMGVAQLLLLLPGYIWGICWAVNLYKTTVGDGINKNGRNHHRRHRHGDADEDEDEDEEGNEDEIFPPDIEDPQRPPLIWRMRAPRMRAPRMRAPHMRAPHMRAPHDWRIPPPSDWQFQLPRFELRRQWFPPPGPSVPPYPPDIDTTPPLSHHDRTLV